jgi:hypothetical protein
MPEDRDLEGGGARASGQFDSRKEKTMNLHRPLTGLFASAALALTFALWADAGSGRPLLAASATCGGYSGPLCSKTESCIEWFGLFKTCTTIYTYYDTSSSKTGGSGETSKDSLESLEPS